MSGVLASVDWGVPALSLLTHAGSLDPARPAVLHIRHTARHQYSPSPVFDERTVVSTEVGKQAAVDFGASLPLDRRYTLFHTYLDRARETAEELRRGILGVGGKAEIGGVIPCTIILDWKAHNERMQSRLQKHPEDGAFQLTCEWISGHVPTTIRKSSGEFARECAGIVMQNLRGVPPDAFHVYVSHDTWVLALMFHWFTVLPHVDGLRFLDGFLMQLCDDGISVWFRDQSRLCEYPYWWPK